MRKKELQLLVLAAALAPGLRAQTLGVGAEATLAKPIKNIAGSNSWLQGRDAEGFGGHVSWYLAHSQALVLRADLLDLKTGTVAMVPNSKGPAVYFEQAKVTMQSAGFDYDFYLSGRTQDGAYLGFGLGASKARFQNAYMLPKSTGPAPAVWPANQTKVAPQFALVAGWSYMEYVGLEFRFAQSNYKGVGFPGTLVEAPVFGLSLVVEF